MIDQAKVEKLIRLAQQEAEKAIESGNPPFGSVLTDPSGNVVETAYNTQNSTNDPTAHAEINLLRKAGAKLKSRYLEGYHLFSNAESCSMCVSACVKARIRHFYVGASHEPSMDPMITIYDIAKKQKITRQQNSAPFHQNSA